MKLTTLALSALIALLWLGPAHGQTSSGGMPPLPRLPQTPQLPENAGTTKFTFIVAGDNRPQGKKPNEPQPATLGQIFNDAQRFKPAFFLWCGDTISGHTADGATLQSQYQAFLAIAATAKVPVFNAPGNHEMDIVKKKGNDTDEIPDKKMFDFYLQYMQPANSPSYAYGAFNYGNSRFIALNTEEVAPKEVKRSSGPIVGSGIKLDPGYVGGQQTDMLSQDLAANSGKDHIFVFMHHPIKPSKAPSGLDPQIANTLQNIFQNSTNVSYVLAAHEHLYYNASGPKKTPPSWTSKISKSPVYLVTGGAGAPLDKCGKNPNTYCHKVYHYLVFTVDGPKVTVQVVELPKPTTKKKNGGKK